MNPVRLLIFSPIPEEGASARFRVYQYLPALEQDGFEVTVSSFCTPELFRILYDRGHVARKLALGLRQVLQQCRALTRASRYDLVLVHREVLPIGPPVIERILARSRHVPLVYDFDDAIYLSNVSDANRLMARLKVPRKVPAVIRESSLVIAGNNYLAAYARRYNSAVTVVPTCVDTKVFRPRPETARSSEPPVVGWIGSPTTRRYLLELGPTLARVAASDRFRLLVSGAGAAVTLDRVPVSNVPWSLRDEAPLFSGCDIGIYPLPDSEWTRGKCGFKAIQFMACGVPVVASAVGVNREIVEDGVNGFLASTPTEWEDKLGRLLSDPALRSRLGRAGRETVEARYSLATHAPTLTKTLRGTLNGTR